MTQKQKNEMDFLIVIEEWVFDVMMMWCGIRWVCVWICLCDFTHNDTLDLKQHPNVCISTNTTEWTHQGNVVNLLSPHTPVFKQSHLFHNSVLVSQSITVVVSMVVMCLNIDSISFVLLFLWNNNIIMHWCINRLYCYHCCSNTHSLNTIMDNDRVIMMKDGTVK